MSDNIAGEIAFLEGVEIVNNSRTTAYIQAGFGPENLRVLSGCTCPENLVVGLIGCDPVTGSYSTPVNDPAPWYDPAYPESSEFAGFYTVDFNGIGSTYTREVFPVIGGGGILGRLRAAPRTLSWRGFLFGRTCCGVGYGLRWLTETLAGARCGAECSGEQLDMMICCPQKEIEDAIATIPEECTPEPCCWQQWIDLPGTSGNFISTPDSAALSITGDIDIRVKVAMDDWTPAANSHFITKWSGTTSSWQFRLTPASNLEVLTSSNGTDVEAQDASTVVTGVLDGATKWVRVTVDVDNGAAGHDTKFYTSDDGTTWTQLGTTVTVAQVLTIFDGTAAVEIGAVGGSSTLAGNVYYAEIRNGIDGPVVGRFDANAVEATGPQTPTTVPSNTGETWTINGNDWEWGGVGSGIEACPEELCWYYGGFEYGGCEYAGAADIVPTEAEVIASFSDTAFRSFFNVGLVEGPLVLSERQSSCGCGCSTIMEIEFSLVAGNPHFYREPIVLADCVGFPESTDCPWVESNDPADCAEEECPDPVPCTTDPNCPTPTLPVIVTTSEECVCTPINPVETCVAVPASTWGRDFQGVPIFQVFSGSQPIYSTQIRIIQNSVGLTCDVLAEDPCLACTTIGIRFIPANSTLTIDGVNRRITIECPGGEVQPGEPFLTGGFEWPVFSCSDYCVCARVDGLTASEDACFSMSVVPREM